MRFLRALPLLLLLACGHDFDRLQFDAIVTSDLGGHINTTDLAVPEGLVLKANITAYNDGNDVLDLRIRAVDPTILDVENVVTARGYTFIGRRAGTTDVTFEADGHIVLTITATVVPQP